VDALRWDMTPQNYFFEEASSSKKVNMAEYCLRVYGKKIMDMK
jgi:hypothetical protein